MLIGKKGPCIILKYRVSVEERRKVQEVSGGALAIKARRGTDERTVGTMFGKKC